MHSTSARCTRGFRRWAGLPCALAVLVALAPPAWAESKGLDDPFRQPVRRALEGKTVAFVPVVLASDLAQAWLAGLRKELEPAGVKIVLRDPNWNTGAGAQALVGLINDKPDVIVVHNPDVQTYARLLQRAEQEGIAVVQVNMRSNYASAAFVGADFVEIGERSAQAAVGACKGGARKIAIIQGALAAAASAYTLKGVDNVLAAHPEIKVVSSQAADWDASKAKGIAQTVLKQHPDLCAIVGFWDGMDVGTAAAVREAGLTGKVFLVTSGGGEQTTACDQVKSGAFSLYLSYDAPMQGRQMAAQIKWLLQGKAKAMEIKSSLYSTLTPITPANASTPGTCWRLGGA